MKFNFKKIPVAVAVFSALSSGWATFALKYEEVKEPAFSQKFFNDWQSVKNNNKVDGSMLEFEVDGKKQNLRTIMVNEGNEVNINLRDFGDWLSRAVVLNSEHLFSKDLILAKASNFENTLGNYDFCIFVDSQAVPNEVEGVGQGGVRFSESAFKGLNRLKMVIKDCWTQENPNPATVLEKDLELNQNCFKFSLNKNEIEFGKTYRIEFLNTNGEVVGYYSIDLPKAEVVSEENESEVGKLKSLGDKSRARG